MMAMLWAQKIMCAETKGEALALYKRVPVSYTHLAVQDGSDRRIEHRDEKNPREWLLHQNRGGELHRGDGEKDHTERRRCV